MDKTLLLTDNPITFFHQVYVLDTSMSISQLGALREISNVSKVTHNKAPPPTFMSIPDHH